MKPGNIGSCPLPPPISKATLSSGILDRTITSLPSRRSNRPSLARTKPSSDSVTTRDGSFKIFLGLLISLDPGCASVHFRIGPGRLVLDVRHPQIHPTLA